VKDATLAQMLILAAHDRKIGGTLVRVGILL